jgi:hypothetical protein
MRKLIFILPLFLFGCPVTEDTEKKESLPAKDDSTKTAEKETEKPAADVAIFGFKAETASYKKGKDGARGTLQLGGVADQVASPDGKNKAEMLKVLESNLFPSDEVPASLPDAKNPSNAAPHAWVMWMDKQTEVALYKPFYSAGARTLTFEVDVVDGTLPEGSLGKVELRLQDCPDQSYVCAKSTLTACNHEIGPVGTCWQWLSMSCTPCHCDGDMKMCVEKNPKCCDKEDEPCYPARLGPHGWNRFCL